MLSNCCLEYCVMERFSTAPRVLIVKTFYQNGECATQAVRKRQNIFGRNKATCESNICRPVTKFETAAVPQF